MNAMLSWTGTRLGQKGLCRWLLPLLTSPRLPVHAFQSTVHVHRLPLLPLHSVLYSSTVCRQHPMWTASLSPAASSPQGQAV